MANDHNFKIKNGLAVAGTEVIDSSLNIGAGGAADSSYDLKVHGLARFEGVANFISNFQVGGLTVITSSRNMQNIGNINIGGYYAMDGTTLIDTSKNILNVGSITASDTIHSKGFVNYSANEDEPYLIASTSGWTGATTNWNTYGFQHRLKTNSSGVPRVTIDVAGGEAFSVNNGKETHMRGKVIVAAGAHNSSNASNADALIVGSAFVSSSAQLFVDGFSRFKGSLYLSEESTPVNYIGLTYSNDRLTLTENADATAAIDAPDGYYISNQQVITAARNLTNIGTISSGAITASGSSVFNPTDGMVIINEPSTDTDLQTTLRVGTESGGLFLTTNNAIISKGAYYDGNWYATAATGSSIDFTGNNRITFNTFSGATAGNTVTLSPRGYFNSSGLTVVGSITANTLDTGHGANELYPMNQAVRTTDSPTFASLNVTGDLNITGDINSVNVTDLDVVDKTITVASGAANSAAADGAGLVVGGAGAHLKWDNGDSKWGMNKSLQFDDTPTTTNQNLGIYWTGFDKEGTTDFTDNAYIRHTTSIQGFATALEIASSNDANDGILFTTHGDSKLKHNSNNIATETWVNAQGFLTSVTESDTLNTVTSRGNTTSNSISTGAITTTGGTITINNAGGPSFRIRKYNTTDYDNVIYYDNTTSTSGLQNRTFLGRDGDSVTIRASGNALIEFKDSGIESSRDIDLNGNVLDFQNTSTTNRDHIWHDDAGNFGRAGTFHFASDTGRKNTGNAAIIAGAYGIGTTEVITNSRNLVNIGTISSGAITSSGGLTASGTVSTPQVDYKNGSNIISAEMLSTDTLSFTGDSGQLFSITDSSSGTIFSVNDISGVPSIEVEDDGTIRLAETFGNVGIGTDNPSTKLEVVGGAMQLTNGTSGTYIKAVQTTNTANAGFYMASGSANWFNLVDTSGNYQIYDGDAAQIRLQINGSGNVGIGATPSSYKLEVAGTIHGNATSGAHRFVSTSSTGPVMIVKPADAQTGLHAIFEYRSANQGSANYMMVNGTSTYFATYEGAMPTDESKMIRITPNNSLNPSVHIGDSGSDDAQLVIDNTIRLSGKSTTTSYINAGNFGIGNNSPQDKLHILAPINSGIRLQSPTAANSYGDENRIEFHMSNETGSQATGNPAARVSSYLQGNDNRYGLKFYTRTNSSTFGTLMTLTGDKKVGIGTETPADKLEIRNNHSQLRLTDSDDNKFVQFSYSGGKLIVRNNNSGTSVNQFTLAENNRFGIGTTAPSYTLDVHSGAANDAIVRTSTGNSNAGAYFYASSGLDGFYGLELFHQGTAKWFIGGYGNNRLGFFAGAKSTASNEKMSLTTTGNFGIGTTAPSTKLHLYTGGVGTNTGVTDMLRIELNRNDHGTTPSGPAILFKDQDTNNLTNEARIKMMTVNDTDYGDNDEAASNLVFETTNGGTASDKMIITGRGNVGIGTTNPGATLHLQNSSTNSEVMRITTTGDNPDRNMYFQSDHIYSNGALYWGDGSHRNLHRASYHTFHYGTSNTEIMRINSNGVGIGAVTSPQSLLDISDGLSDTKYLRTHFPAAADYNSASANTEERVPVGLRFGWYSDYWQIGAARSGNANIDGFIISMSGYERLVINNAGNVGIGTTTPSEKLHVSGNFKLTGNIHLNGTSTGNNGISYGTGTTQPSVWFWGKDHSSYPGQIHLVSRSDNAAADSGEISFWDYTGSTWNRNMVIRKDGKVGIGQDTPSALLHVHNNSAYSSMLFRVDGQYNDVKFNGGSSGTNGVWEFENIGTWAQTRFYVQDANNDNGRLTFDFRGNGGSNKILAGTSGGRVGIGTTNPLYPLQVTGSIYANGGNVYIDSGNKLVWGNSTQWIEGNNDTNIEFGVESTIRARLEAEALQVEGGAGLRLHGGARSDAPEGTYYNWFMTGQGTDTTTWKKVCDVTIETGLYRALAMSIQARSQSGNFGSTVAVATEEYTALFYRSAGTQDDQNNATLIGQNAHDHELRIVKTSTGNYELQAKQKTTYRDLILEIYVLSTNGGTVTIPTTGTNGSTSGTVYNITRPTNSTSSPMRALPRIQAPALNLKASDGDNLLILDEDGGRGRARFYRNNADAYGMIFHDGTNFALSTTAGDVLVNQDTLTLQYTESEQTNARDTTTVPSASAQQEALQIRAPSYQDGRYTTQIAKIDRSGGLPLYFRESLGTANSYTNRMRIGTHGRLHGGYVTETFGSAMFQGRLAVTSGEMLRRYEPAWASGTPEHTVLYNSYKTALGDYTTLKTPGNSTSAHGVFVVGDNGAHFGRTNLEVGDVVANNSATAPFDSQNWGRIDATGFHSYSAVNASTSISAGGAISGGSNIGNLDSTSGIGQQMEKGDTALTTLRFDSDRWRLYAGGSGGASEIFSVRQDGNIGIGTDDPKGHLQSNSSSYLPFNTSGRYLTINNSNGAFLNLQSTASTQGEQIGGLMWTDTNGAGDAHKQVAQIDTYVENAGTDANDGATMRFWTKVAGAANSTATMLLYHNRTVEIPEGTLYLGTYGNTDDGIIYLRGSTANKQASIRCTNGNLHIDANAGNNTYINYYTGNSTYFGTGAGGTAAEITAAGSVIASSFRPNVDNAWKIRGNNGNAYLSFEYSTSASLADTNIQAELGNTGNFTVGGRLSTMLSGYQVELKKASTSIGDGGGAGALNLRATGNFYIRHNGNDAITFDGTNVAFTDVLTMPTSHSKQKIGLFGGVGQGAEWLGTSANTLELSGTNINLNGASGSGTANLQMGGVTVISSAKHLENIAKFDTNLVPRTFALASTGGSSNQWLYIGQIDSLGQHGATVSINLHSNSGYNASDAQNAEAVIRFKTSNSSSNVGGFYGDCQYYLYGQNGSTLSELRVVQVNTGTFQFYGKFNSHTGVNSNYTVAHSSGTWTNGGTFSGTAPTGTQITATKRRIFTSGFAQNDDLNLGSGDLTCTVLSASGISTFTNASNSTSTTNGAVRITGGLGVGYNVHAGGVVRCNSGFVVNTTTVIDSSRNLQEVVMKGGTTGARFEQGSWMYDSGNKGRLFFGTGNSYYKTATAGGKHLFMDSNGTTDASADVMFDASGNGHFAGNVTAYSSSVSSDARLKKNIRPIESATKTVKQLNGVVFDWKKTERGTDQLGFIAQEIEQVLPSLVTEVDTLKDENTETHKTVNYAALVPMLVESIKEQSAQIDAQQEQINQLTALVNELKEK